MNGFLSWVILNSFIKFNLKKSLIVTYTYIVSKDKYYSAHDPTLLADNKDKVASALGVFNLNLIFTREGAGGVPVRAICSLTFLIFLPGTAMR